MTTAMQRRGVLVRQVLPAEIMVSRTELAEVLGIYGQDLTAAGSDAMTKKALVPWARYFSKHMSPTPTNGWYVVYLFHADAAGVSLCLSHGSTVFKSGSFQSRSPEQINELMTWALQVVGDEFSTDPNVRPGVVLGKSGLGAKYEKTTVFSKFYRTGSVPDDVSLREDLVAFGRVLAKLYHEHDAGRAPGGAGPEVTEVMNLVDALASPLKRPRAGQGWGLSGPARKVVELRAMAVAERWLDQEGFKHKNVSANDSCDFRASRSGENWVIEVKGTTGNAGSVLVTRNEVKLHRESHPRNALLVVHGIKLSSDQLVATGGELLALSPWEVDESRLSPTSYEYRLN